MLVKAIEMEKNGCVDNVKPALSESAGKSHLVLTLKSQVSKSAGVGDVYPAFWESTGIAHC